MACDMPRFTSFFLQLLLGSARVQALAAGLLLGVVASALVQRSDSGWLAPLSAAIVVLAGAASVLCFTLDRAQRRDAARKGPAARQAVICTGLGILLAMHAQAWLA